MRSPNFYADLKDGPQEPHEPVIDDPGGFDQRQGFDVEAQLETYRQELDQLVTTGRIDEREAMHRFRQRDNEGLVAEATQARIDQLLEDNGPERDYLHDHDFDGPYLGGGLSR